MKRILFIIWIVLCCSNISSQGLEEDSYTEIEEFRRTDLPAVTFGSDNQLLMRAFYPEYYRSERQIRQDIRWVDRNDSLIIETWDIYGDTILALIKTLSGIDWEEKEINIRLLKYLRRDILYDPPAIPLEGIKMESYIEAAPSGWHQLLNIIRILAGWNLLQMERPGHSGAYWSNHPLLEKTAYRFDVIVNDLAVACAEYVIEEDSLEEILSGEQWKRHNPGHQVYENHFRYNWLLSPEQPLITYLAEEPFNSALVELTRPPRIVSTQKTDVSDHEPVRLAAGGGRLGFSVIRTQKGYLEVVDIDTTGLVFNSGLMVGDKIKRVNGEYARNARELMSKILEKIDSDGIYMIVIRENEEIGILLLPQEENYTPEGY